MTDEVRRLIAGIALVGGTILLVQAFRGSSVSLPGIVFACFAILCGLYGVLRPAASVQRPDYSADIPPSYVPVYFGSLGIGVALIVWGAFSGGGEMVAGAILATPLLLLGLAGMRLLVERLWSSRR